MPLHRLAALGIAGIALHSAPAQALEFDLPTNGDTVVGSPSVVIPTPENSLYDLARYYDTGILDIKLANPGVHPWVPGKNQRIIIPTQYILPKLSPRLDPLTPRPPKQVITAADPDAIYGVAALFTASDLDTLLVRHGHSLDRVLARVDALPDSVFAPRPVSRVQLMHT